MNRICMQDFAGKKINMHTHTTRCQHAVGEDREYVEKAIEAGYEVLGFSDHGPYIFADGHNSTIRMGMDELEGYVDSVLSLKREYAKDIDIYCGLEMEYFPELFDATMMEIDKYPVDYMILGQHFFDDEEGWISPKRPWDDEEHLKMYVDRVLAGIKTDRFFYVAHPDLMNFTGENALYEKYMGILLDEFKKRNMPIELNINGFRSMSHYPSERFIKMGIANNNTFVIGVDAHAPKNFLELSLYENCKNLVKNLGGNVINTL